MKNFMAVNISKTLPWKDADVLIRAQIENSLECGWDKKDVIFVSNKDFDIQGIKPQLFELNESCLTGSKLFALRKCIESFDRDVMWAHDLDCWQNVAFGVPTKNLENEKLVNNWDVGATYYSHPKFNGGSVFWKKSGIDILNKIIDVIIENKDAREEPALNAVLKSYNGRVAVLNNTYNVGCSGFVKRYERSIKPIHVCHFHPTNRIAWETHALDRNGRDFSSVSPRLRQLIKRYYPSIADQLQEDGVKKATEIRRQRN